MSSIYDTPEIQASKARCWDLLREQQRAGKGRVGDPAAWEKYSKASYALEEAEKELYRLEDAAWQKQKDVFEERTQNRREMADAAHRPQESRSVPANARGYIDEIGGVHIFEG